MELSQCSTELPALSLKLRLYGAKQINTRYVRTIMYHIFCRPLKDGITHKRTFYPCMKVPRMCFLNKMDRTGANFYRCVDMIKKLLGES